MSFWYWLGFCHTSMVFFPFKPQKYSCYGYSIYIIINFQPILSRGLYPIYRHDRPLTFFTCHNSVNLHQIPTKIGMEIHFNEPFVFQKYVFAFYGQKCKWRIRKKHYNITLLAHISGLAGTIYFKFGMYVDSSSWGESLQQIWLNWDKRSWSYISRCGNHIFVILSIYSWCGTPALWAARHTTVCLDYICGKSLAWIHAI